MWVSALLKYDSYIKEELWNIMIAIFLSTQKMHYLYCVEIILSEHNMD